MPSFSGKKTFEGSPALPVDPIKLALASSVSSPEASPIPIPASFSRHFQHTWNQILSNVLLTLVFSPVSSPSKALWRPRLSGLTGGKQGQGSHEGRQRQLAACSTNGTPCLLSFYPRWTPQFTPGATLISTLGQAPQLFANPWFSCHHPVTERLDYAFRLKLGAPIFFVYYLSCLGKPSYTKSDVFLHIV